MAELVQNPNTGETLRLEGNQWVPAEVAEDESGNRLAFDGESWQPVFEANPAFERRIAAMDPQGISIARSRNDPFGEYLRQKAVQPVAGESEEERAQRLYGSLPQRERPGMLEGMLRAGGQGQGFGWMDEATAAVSATLAPLVGQDQGTWQERYQQYLSREREDIERFREDQPVAAYGAEIAGALPTAVLTAPSTAGGLAARTLAGAGTGLAQGALYGAGAAEEGERIPGALVGGTAGGLIGAAAPAVGAGVQNVARRVAEGRQAGQMGMPRAAYNVLMRAAQADETLTGQGAQNVQRAGPQAMLADAGPSMRTLLDTATQGSGPAAAQARQAVSRRATQAGQSVTQLLDDVLGQPQGIRTVERGLREGTSAARQAAYDAAYSQPINYADDLGRQIEDIVSNRVPMSAIRKANQLMRVEGKASQQIKASISPEGVVTYERMPDVRQIDYITRGLRSVADAENAKGMLGGTTDVGRAYGGLSRTLRNLTRQAVPEYGTALDTAADPISQRAALKIGRQALSGRVAPDELADDLAGMSQAEMMQVRQGIRSELDKAMGNVKRALTDSNMDAREAIKAIQTLTTRNNRDKMRLVLGDGEADRLFAGIDEALASFELRAGVAENSRTFARTALNEAIREQTEEGVLNALRSGRPVNATQQAAQVVGRRTPGAVQQIQDETYSALVGALTGPRGPQALQQVQQMQAAAAGAPGQTQRQLAEQLVAANTGLFGPVRQAF